MPNTHFIEPKNLLSGNHYYFFMLSLTMIRTFDPQCSHWGDLGAENGDFLVFLYGEKMAPKLNSLTKINENRSYI